MKHPTVTAEDLVKYVADIEVELAGHFGQGWHASVKYHALDGVYRVYDHRELVMATVSADVAAESFNSIRPRMEGTQT